jgi:ParB family transcriptional regulator, chromosome partitioning protein
MSKPPERKALGKGLSALLPPRQQQHPEPPSGAAPTSVAGAGAATQPATAPDARPESISRLPIDDIHANPLQPRSVFDPARLEELAQSIRANGIIQPLVVRKADSQYQLVAGERRLRAARIAGLQEIPVVVQEIPDDRLLEITLIENIQREDLNPIEVAHAFERLLRELNLSHDELGQRTGKDRATVTNTLRLLKLPDDVQELVATQQLSPSHARTLLGMRDPDLISTMARKVIAQSWSVRQIEKAVQIHNEPPAAAPASPAAATPVDPNVKAAVQEMERTLGTRVRIVEKGPSRGRIEIEYYSIDELDRIYSLIVGEEKAEETE